MFRQGDVLLVPATERSADGWESVAADGPRVVLAHGEDSGHAHAIAEGDATLWQRPGSPVRLLVVARPTALLHEEHAAIRLAPGAYLVRLQRTYAPPARPRKQPGSVPVGD